MVSPRFQISRQCGVTLSLKTLFEKPVLSDLAQEVAALQMALVQESDGPLEDDDLDGLSEQELMALLEAEQ